MTETDKKNPGEPLKTTREKLGLSLNDISLSTKINPRILKAIEEGDRSALPPKSFARGFIRSYASYLKIDPAPIIESFDFQDQTLNEIPVTNGKTDSGPVTANGTKETKKSSSPRLFDTSKALVIGILSVLIVTIFGIKQIVDKYAKEGEIVPPEDITKIEETTSDENVSATPSEDGTPDSTSEDTESKPEDESKVEVATEKPAPSVEVKSTPAQTPSPTATPAPVVSSPVDATPSPAQTPAPATETPKVETQKPAAPTATAMQEIIIEALDKVDITVSLADGKTEKISLNPESTHTIKARGKIALDISDGGMVNIIQNGRDKGVPGDLGKPKKVTFP